MGRVFCIGECLIDMMPSATGVSSYVAKTGGAPANVCACVARLGAPAYYIGRLSTDAFSEIITDSLAKCGVDMRYVARDERAKTAIAFVELSKTGDRSFRFLREGTADLNLCEEDIPDCFTEGDILHFCSVGLVESPSKYAHKKALDIANRNNATVSFDVNLRLNLYRDEKTCRDTVIEFLPYADLLKVTDDELVFLTGISEECEAVRQLFEMSPKAKCVFVTKGERGASVYDRDMNCVTKPAIKTEVVDTTGAGDCFCGSILYRIATNGLRSSAEDYCEYLDFALRACAKVCSRRGAMEAMPSLEELNEN